MFALQSHRQKPIEYFPPYLSKEAICELRDIDFEESFGVQNISQINFAKKNAVRKVDGINLSEPITRIEIVICVVAAVVYKLMGPAFGISFFIGSFLLYKS